MSSWKWFLLSFFGCGIAFWAVDLIIAAIDPTDQGWAATISCPIGLIGFYFIMLRLRKSARSGPSTAISAICGIWMLGLSFILVAQKIRSEHGLGGFNWSDLRFLLISSFLPTRILLFTGLEGSAIALVLGTVALAICHFKFEGTRWIVPPSVLAALRQRRRDI